MSVENKIRSLLSSPSDAFLTSNRGPVILGCFYLQKLALFWLCIGFELALFFPRYQLSNRAYPLMRKSLTAFFQMLRLALFSQTNPISPRRTTLFYRERPDMISAAKPSPEAKPLTDMDLMRMPDSKTNIVRSIAEYSVFSCFQRKFNFRTLGEYK